MSKTRTENYELQQEAGFISMEMLKSGKIRQRFLVRLLDGRPVLIIVTSDKMSALDYVLRDQIPGKGEALNEMSKFWLELPEIREVCPNHLITADNAKMPSQFQRDEYKGRTMMVKYLAMLPVEAIVRGYLTGSGLKSYARDRTVCGIALPAGLEEASRLPEPIFTPTTKAEIGEHDEHISFSQMVQMLDLWLSTQIEFGNDKYGEAPDYSKLDARELAEQVRDYSLQLYQTAADYARDCGIIIADTKFEFGLDKDGTVTLADEVLTPDSSRFWPLEGYQPGKVQPSFDKQPVRDWLRVHWDGEGEPPHLPIGLIDETSRLYYEALIRLTWRDTKV